MNELQVLIGGKAGEGINAAGLTVTHLLNQLGYRMYMYFDYPSLIKGGHNFCIVRAAGGKIGAHRTKVDFVLAMNQDTIDLHHHRFNEKTVFVFDSDTIKKDDPVRKDGAGVPVKEILKAEEAPPIMGNTAMIGAFAKTAGFDWSHVEAVLRKHLPKGIEKNLAVARRSYEMQSEHRAVPRLEGAPMLPVMTGNEAVGLGLLSAGLEEYVAYPMTPTSNLLHFLAEVSPSFPLTVTHPENEIAVMLMALGFSYAGKKTAVGTSGGGFCLMTEGFSFAGQAELPVVVVLGQRTGPSTGLPTYTGQTELNFARYAGQGEFPRIIVAPGDAEQAYYWSGITLALAWKYQVPSIILVDKTLAEGTYSFDRNDIESQTVEPAAAVQPSGVYRRYKDTENGVSPGLNPGAPGAVVKVSSYSHDESGITTESAQIVDAQTRKRQRKTASLSAELEGLPCVKTFGNPGAKTAILCWSSNLGLCTEIAGLFGYRVIQPVVLEPFPVNQFSKALSGVTGLISVEDNATGQLSALVSFHGAKVDHRILRYDGRPFTLEELAARVKEVA
ncbi:MAG: 2-oxoacid:acceptor oxidoreductase subunit alpha [Methanoregulaceae archaeon]|nr:2-oxoacid:acceptor oxidoreductase subunit alpha [Methanoregulaceae archaeon]